MFINKIFKRLICFVLSLSLFISTNTVAYASDSSAEFKMNYKVIDGGYVNVQVDISEKSNLGAVMFDITYDSKLLEVVSSSADEKIFSMVEFNDKKKGKVLYSAISVDGASIGGTLLNIKFKMIGNTSAVKLNIKEATLADDNFTDVLNEVKANSASALTIEVDSEKENDYSGTVEKDKSTVAQEEKRTGQDSSKKKGNVIQDTDGKEIKSEDENNNVQNEKTSSKNILIICLILAFISIVLMIVVIRIKCKRKQ